MTGRERGSEDERGGKAERGDKAERRAKPERGGRAERGGTAGPRNGRAKKGPIRFFGLGGTRRAAVLAIVVCALALTVAVPLRTYLGQRSEVTEQVRKQEQLRAEVAELEKRKAELSDPAQIQAEARERLRYVMPGETPYLVQLPGDAERATRPDSRRPEATAQPWYGALWKSLDKQEGR